MPPQVGGPQDGCVWIYSYLLTLNITVWYCWCAATKNVGKGTGPPMTNFGSMARYWVRLLESAEVGAWLWFFSDIWFCVLFCLRATFPELPFQGSSLNETFERFFGLMGLKSQHVTITCKNAVEERTFFFLRALAQYQGFVCQFLMCWVCFMFFSFSHLRCKGQVCLEDGISLFQRSE